MIRVFTFSLCLMCSLGNSVRETPAAEQSSADREFDKLAEEFLTGHLAFRPHVALELGLHEHDGKLADYSAAPLAREHARLKQFEQRFASLPQDKLSPSVRIDLQVLLCGLRKARFDFDGSDDFHRNPQVYVNAVQIDNFLLRDFAPLADRVRSIISIERQLPKLFAAARENLRPQLPKPLVETAIKITNGAADFLERDLPLAVSELKDASLRAELDVANKAAIAELRAYSQWLQTERLPKADHRFAIGRDQFTRMLREHESVMQSPEEILELGLRELKREQDIFVATAKRLAADKPAIDVFKAIQEDHPTEQGLIPDTARNLEAIRQFNIDHKIASFPSDVRVKVAETPQFRRATSFASMDSPGPFETHSTEAFYYVTPTDPSWTAAQKNEWLTAFNYYTTDVVSIHEAYPGHYLQHLHRNAAVNSRVRKSFSSYAFVEGWAHYTEQMLLDEGFPDDKQFPNAVERELKTLKYRLAQSDEALLRLCRLCCSIKMHCADMTVDEATKFFQDNCYYQEQPARQEAVRGTHDPGYLYYTLGKLMILKLRRDWQAQEGTTYSLQRFHDEMLRHGAPSIPILRQVMLNDRKLWDKAL